MLAMLDDLGVWADLDPQIPAWPEINGITANFPAVLARGMKYFSGIDRSLLYLMAICAPAGPGLAKDMLQRLQVSRRYPRLIMAAVGALQAMRLIKPGMAGRPGSWQPILGGLSPEGCLLCLAAADAPTGELIWHYLARRRETRLTISGADLQALGLDPGPQLRHILARVDQARLDGAPGGRESELALAKAIIDNES